MHLYKFFIDCDNSNQLTNESKIIQRVKILTFILGTCKIQMPTKDVQYDN